MRVQASRAHVAFGLVCFCMFRGADIPKHVVGRPILTRTLAVFAMCRGDIRGVSNQGAFLCVRHLEKRSDKTVPEKKRSNPNPSSPELETQFCWRGVRLVAVVFVYIPVCSTRAAEQTRTCFRMLIPSRTPTKTQSCKTFGLEELISISSLQVSGRYNPGRHRSAS